MALSISVDQVNQDGKEMLTYGTSDFPISFFDDDLVKVAVPWHWHDEFEIVIITEGTVEVKIANSVVTLRAGKGYFANGGILHSAKLLTKTGHQHCMVFSPNLLAHENDIIWNTYISPILGNHLLPFVKLSSDIPWQKEILFLSEDSWHIGAYEDNDYPLVVRENLSRSFSLILKHLDLLLQETNYTDKVQKDQLRIKKILLFIENNFASNITIDEIAKSADISTSTCLRLFKNVLNTTPIQYLIEFRVQKSAELLERRSAKNISEIAYICGFSDATYYNRCFKKIYGCTPTEFITE